MPTPRIDEYRPQVSVEGGQRVTPQLSGVSLGGAISDIGAGLEHVQRSEAANFALKTTSDAEQNWHEEILKRQQTAQPGAPNFTPDLLKDYDKYVKAATKNAPGPLAASMVNKQLLQLRSTIAQRAITFEANEAVRHNTEVAAQSIDNAGNEVMNDPSVYSQRLADRQALIGQMNLDPSTREKLNQHARDELSKYATIGAIERDPYQTMIELASGKSPLPYVNSLSPEIRTQMMNHADSVLRARVADAQRIDTMAEKEQEKTRQSVLMQGVLTAKQGQLTPEWITQHAPLLKAEDVDHLYRELAGGENVKSDMHTYSDLLVRASGGEDVTTETTNAYTKGLLSHEDFTNLIKTSAHDMPNSYKRGVEYIKTAGQVSQLEPDPAKATTLANMLDDWNDWNRLNPKATDAEASGEYRDIVRRYQLVEADKNTLTLRVPKYFVGSRAAPDIVTTAQKTKDALDSGELSRDDFNKQALLIQQWQHAVEILQAKRAAADAAKKANQ